MEVKNMNLFGGGGESKYYKINMIYIDFKLVKI